MDNVLDKYKLVGLVEAEIEDNCIEHGVRGFLKHDDIMRMISHYTEEDKQARVYGKFQHLTGLVFKSFSRKIHVIRPFRIDKREFCVIERLDPHTRTPDACLWVAFDRKGNKYIVDELWMNGTTADLAHNIKAKAINYRIIDRRIDPSAFITDQHKQSQLSLGQELDQLYGISYLPASKDRTMANRRIMDALDYQEVGGLLVKPPELFIFDTCVRTIWELEHLQYHEYKGKAAEYHSQSEKPMDKDDHMIENLGRALLYPIAFEEYRGYENEHQSIYSQTPTIDPY